MALSVQWIATTKDTRESANIGCPNIRVGAAMAPAMIGLIAA